MDSRAQFEEYIRRTFTYALLERHDEEGPFKGEYIDASRETEWEQWQAAWQASRSAIEVELPEKISEHNRNENGYVLPHASSYDEAIDDCAEGVIAAGIGIKLRNSYD